MLKRFKYDTTKEKGQTVVLVAVMLMALLGLTAMAIDLSNVFVQRRNMQNGADAAALAGARLTALYAADPTMSLRYRDVYFAVLNAAQANGAEDIEAYLVHCEDREPDTSYSHRLSANNYGAVERCPCACGVWVRTEKSFGTYLSHLFGLQVLEAAAEAKAEFGLPQWATGLAPIALHKSVLQQGEWGKVGSVYTIWDSKQEAGSTRGWVSLDCKYPAKCSPDANSLKTWMDPPYYTGQVWVGDSLEGDPGTKASVLDHANPPEILVIPIYDVAYHYNNKDICNPKSEKYNWSQCLAGEVYQNVLPVYTSDGGYNGRYYYHVYAFAAFQVQRVQKGGSNKYIKGKFISFVVPSEWKCPTCPGHCEYAMGREDSLGLVVVKLTK